MVHNEIGARSNEKGGNTHIHSSITVPQERKSKRSPKVISTKDNVINYQSIGVHSLPSVKTHQGCKTTYGGNTEHRLVLESTFPKFT